MGVIPIIIVTSLTIGGICNYLLYLHDKEPYLKKETYQALGAISFIFYITGSSLCLLMLAS